MTAKITMNQVLKAAEQARDEWLKDREQTVEADIRQQLDRAVKSIVTSAIGFENRWGDKWEVNNCNGVNQWTALGRAIVERADTAARAWFDELTEAPKLTAKEMADMKRAFREEYMRVLRYQAMKVAQERAAADAHKIVNSIVSKDVDAEAAE
jgi:hypothetical protein